MGFRVLVSDPLAEDAVEAMRAAGLTVDEKTDLTPEQLEAEIGEYDALMVRSATKVRVPIIDAAGKLRLIVRAGVGIDNIDVDYATSKGIEVRNTPSASSNSVAELALGHMLSLARHIGRGTVSVRSGAWEKKALKGVELDGKTLGVIGIGRIGRLLAEKATALGMTAIAYDKFVDESPLPETVKMVSFGQLLREADFVSLHVPFDPELGPVIGASELAAMKPGSYLVNCARGGVVDEAAVAAALDSGHLAGAALDVFADEPPAGDAPLLGQGNVSLTPHIGASTVEAQQRVGSEAAQIVIDFATA
ncbi:MAG: D-2-hydroxyacid dehydrogenase [Candidatus Bipolaricaulota bacterium]|nr:MAG: D-2-hydroxyacid dehydrogenase [Candidatus Bipolaricaulota bacterium]